MLGHTLIVMHQRGAAGQVVEINGKHEVVWRISGLQQPMDAVVVGQDRVLIAEFNTTTGTNQVTERELTGKVLWGKNVMMPVGVQRCRTDTRLLRPAIRSSNGTKASAKCSLTPGRSRILSPPRRPGRAN